MQTHSDVYEADDFLNHCGERRNDDRFLLLTMISTLFNNHNFIQEIYPIYDQMFSNCHLLYIWCMCVNCFSDIADLFHAEWG